MADWHWCPDCADITERDLDGSCAVRTQPIDTRYAGCHFRSRLEARWAVFFDKLGVDWQYEPQGYEVNTGLDDDEKPERYLPDFYLPHLGTFVEVKGDMAERDLRRLCKAVIPHGLSLGATGTPAVVILGDIPRIYDVRGAAHVGLRFYKGDVIADLYTWTADGAIAESLERRQTLTAGNDGGDVYWNDRVAAWVTAAHEQTLSLPVKVESGYTAARSARFEFGA